MYITVYYSKSGLKCQSLAVYTPAAASCDSCFSNLSGITFINL